MTGERIAYIREAPDGSWEIVAGPQTGDILPPDLSGVPIAAIRLEIGKDASQKYFTDDEIAYMYLEQGKGNVLLTAAYACDKIASMYADAVDKSMASSSVALSQKIEHWRQKAEDLRRRAISPTLTPIFQSSRNRAPRFSVGMHDYNRYGSGCGYGDIL
ncbi:MAG TPA: hypothetical protein PK659_10045 [Methanothrix sp.]|nr:hypothetical protein [Methanothrix sp.]HOL44582.1 hypothetical protein [Methanothrix sp.]